ncbi:MAG TPA: thiosulfate oxidation carrier complex protein SoxZ [Burkholderiales bacterium]|nr:thiosulfate oxidation carrier complex protein SoxZ [Burkholderiales bacterium]
MANPMKIRARMIGDIVEVKVLMSHPMETGLRKNEAGEAIPAHFIQTVLATHAERTVLAAQWGQAVSANPFLSFMFKGGQKGDVIRISWTDNKGDSRSDETTIA